MNRLPFSSTGVLLDRMFTKRIIIEKSNGLSSCKIVSATWNSTVFVHIHQTRSPWHAYFQTYKDMHVSKQQQNEGGKELELAEHECCRIVACKTHITSFTPKVGNILLIGSKTIIGRILSRLMAHLNWYYTLNATSSHKSLKCQLDIKWYRLISEMKTISNDLREGLAGSDQI